MRSRWGQRLLLALVALFLAGPIIVVAGVSVNAEKTLQFPPQGFSLAWYAQIVTDPGWRKALLTSVVVAASAAALSLAIAFPLAWSLWRRDSYFGRLLQAVGLAPFILPPVITALGFLSFWATFGAYGAPWTVVFSHAIFFVTLPLVTLSIGFASVEPEIVEAARTMGADERTVLRTVLLPLVGPYILSGYAFAFVLSLNEYIVAYMVAGFTIETLPIKIFNSLRYGYTPTMAAVTVVFVITAALVFGLFARFGDLPRLLGAWASKES
ncbi:MAG: ABC transporter permease [Rhizobiales bacterium]|nr:ABC transporter permease [Hyphomicrobiales bacterium]